MSTTPTARLVVLISGSGSNLQAVLDACGQSPYSKTAALNASVVAVFSNQPDAYGLERAAAAGVPAIAFLKQREVDRSAYDGALAKQVAGFSPDWIVLAGWMRLLSNSFLSRFPDRVINLHPALPGTFPGIHAIERAYEAGRRGEIRKTGVMVHFVPDEGVDTGPALAVEEVQLSPQETLPELEERIHTVEHRLLVAVLRQLTTPE